MVRIADILKNAPTKGEKREKPPLKAEVPSPPFNKSEPLPKPMPLPTPLVSPRQAAVPASPPPEEKRPVTGFSFTRLGGVARQAAAPLPRGIPQKEGPRRYVAAAIQGSEENQWEAANEIYKKALNLAQIILEKAKTGDEIRVKEIHDCLEEIILGLTYGNTSLLDLACSQVVGDGNVDFLCAKMVNKAVLSVDIGIGKQMNKSQLFLLGMAAFLSDLGVTKVLDVVTKKGVLSDGDLEKIHGIPLRTVEILKKIPDLNQVIITVAQEFRERSDGSGPQGIKDYKQLDPFSRVVVILDVFEALTHDRPHRQRLLPHEAMKQILEEGGKKFEEETLRLLIDRIGVYPIGSWVRLSIKEFAKVTGSNPGQPLRPKLKCLLDEKGQPLENPSSLDLARSQTIQILQPVSEEDLSKLAKKSKE